MAGTESFYGQYSGRVLMHAPKKKHLRLFALAGVVLLTLFCIGSCREIPPEIPGGYKPLERRGWPAPAIYDDDPLHPANRWYQRSFAGRDSLGRILDAPAGESPSSLKNPGRLDLAEIRALLAALEIEPPGSEAGRLRCYRDLLIQAEFWKDRDPALAGLHRKAAAALVPPKKKP